MYISSYNTYVATNSADKIEKKKAEEPSKSSRSFSKKLLQNSIKVIDSSSTLGINYISDYKVLNNQQRLKDDTFNSNRTKFSKVKALVSSKSAYLESSKIFPLLLKTSATLSQTPQIDKKMPINAQEAKEQILKHTMVNTYIANDNYYKITA
ncbi:MAG: hypothetical protein QM497_00715 [Sulfurimonas sp.]